MLIQELLFISYAQIVILPTYFHGCLSFITSVNKHALSIWPPSISSGIWSDLLLSVPCFFFFNFSNFQSQPLCTLILALFNNVLQFWSHLLFSSILIFHDKTLEFLQSSLILDISLEEPTNEYRKKYICKYMSIELNNVSDKWKI